MDQAIAGSNSCGLSRIVEKCEAMVAVFGSLGDQNLPSLKTHLKKEYAIGLEKNDLSTLEEL